ncbi:MAG: hypothetical protein Q8Q30_01155 [Candidatus Woesebacteria bacterium]|nr:hypothetical protein [Candidatus Woesebacteria bacterium]
MRLNFAQIRTLSSVSSDIAKALIIALILGQGIITEIPNSVRYQLALVWLFISTFLLILAMMLDRNLKK